MAELRELPLLSLAEVRASSEAEGHPILLAFDEDHGRGGTCWKAGDPGEQTITVTFREPCSLAQVTLEVEEREIARTQEVALALSPDGGLTYCELVRQEFNFSPDGATGTGLSASASMGGMWWQHAWRQTTLQCSCIISRAQQKLPAVMTIRMILFSACLTGLTIDPMSATAASKLQETSPLQMASTLDLLKEEVLDTVALDRAIHFITPEITDVTAHPETYQVSATGGERLQLMNLKTKHILIVEALGTKHDERITTPVALYITDDDKFPHVLLLLPGGKALEAVGSYDAVRSRRARMVQISPVHMRDAFQKKLNH